MPETKFTPEVRETIITAVATNPSIPSAAIRAGISPSTLHQWLHKGSEGDPRYQAFAIEVAQSRTVLKDSVMQSLFDIALDRMHPHAVRAASKLLESIWPQEFASVKHTVQHTPSSSDFDLKNLPTDELRQLAQTIKKLRGIEPNAGAEPLSLPETIEVEAETIEVDGSSKPFARAGNKE
jgi:transposase-like protein